MQHIDLATLAQEGFWPLERNLEGTFRWTRQSFVIAPPGAFANVLLEFANTVEANRMFVTSGGVTEAFELTLGWQKLGVSLHGAGPIGVRLERAFLPPGDGRELGLMLRSALFGNDAGLVELLEARRHNLARNESEFRAGAVVLGSTPPNLRITLSKSCNIANEAACVYCAWDDAKRQETGSPDITPAFLARMGRFSCLASAVTDCSIGEPPMEVGFAASLDAVTEGGRSFEFTSNGQTLGPRKRRAMLGKPVTVYVSIDSATAEGYARYRDRRFDLIIANLRALVAERRQHGNLPRIIVSFLVMRSNRDEIADFLDLMNDVGVDMVKFRALQDDELYFDFGASERAGYRFDYRDELLSFSELQQVAAEIEAARNQFGGSVHIEWQAFIAEQAELSAGAAPICAEPWKTFYVLSRGIVPCCFANTPVASWDDIDQNDLEGSLEKVLNNDTYRELRSELASGRLPNYCLCEKSCPLTKAHLESTANALEAVA